MGIAQMEFKNNHTPKYIGSGVSVLAFLKPKPIRRNIRYYDRQSCDFVGESPMKLTDDRYLRKLFRLDASDKILFSYEVTQLQKSYIERLSGLTIDLTKYQYFMECDLATAT